MRPSIRRLEVMKAIVDCGGVNAAANSLGISQPSVTAHLLALERSYGSKLFIRRRGSRNTLTAAGELRARQTIAESVLA